MSHVIKLALNNGYVINLDLTGYLNYLNKLEELEGKSAVDQMNHTFCLMYDLFCKENKNKVEALVDLNLALLSGSKITNQSTG